MIKHFLFVLCIILSFAGECFAKTIKETINVRNQTDFIQLQNKFEAAVKNCPQKIIINFSPGFFFYKDDHIRLNRLSLNVDIVIRGKNTILVADGRTSFPEDIINSELSPVTTFLSYNTQQILDAWSAAYMADSLIEVLDEDKGLCRLYSSILYKKLNDIINSQYIKVTKWYTSSNYKIIDIKEGYIYFIADDLKKIGKGIRSYNINYDYIYGNILPRFKLFNPSELLKQIGRNEYNNIHECNACCFININRVSLNSIKVEGLEFLGNKNGTQLIRINDVDAKRILISNCTFKGIQSLILNINGTDNVTINNNITEHCFNTGFYISNLCSNIKILNNKFYRCGLAVSQNSCISCMASGYHIADNYFSDFGYGAISLGVWHGHKKQRASYGIVERNEIFYTPSYILEKDQYTLMDSGAIYIRTQNDSVTVCNNYIHDYEGMKDNRGIFCDDGAANLKIYGNLILNIANSYTIDSRRIVNQYVGFRNNTNNIIRNNILGGPIRFEADEGMDNGCELGYNYFLLKNENELPENKYANIESEEKDILMSIHDSKQNFIYVSNSDYDIIKKTPYWNFFRNFIRER